MPRYRVIPPVPGGYAFWNVIDTATIMPNFALATFSIHCPGAEHFAESVCQALNAQPQLSDDKPLALAVPELVAQALWLKLHGKAIPKD